MKTEKHLFKALEEDIQQRLDKVMVAHFPNRTRQYFQKILKEGCVTVNGKRSKPSTQLRPGDTVTVVFPPLKELKVRAKDILFDIIYEDKDLIVVNKPAGMVVHPGTGQSHLEDSLVNAILYHCKGKLSGIGGVMRPGIVHRLDKDTSGLLVVAKTDRAHQNLSAQFKNRQVTKTYYALLVGQLQPLKGMIDAPIGRDRKDRKRMAVTDHFSGKEALTKYQVLQYYKPDSDKHQALEHGCTLVEVALITGRTHQIRVHFASIGFPLVMDAIYGRIRVNKFFEQKYGLKRIFLHAAKLVFAFTEGGEKQEFNAPLPSDLQVVLNKLSKP